MLGKRSQWLIQNSPDVEGGDSIPERDYNLLFGQVFPENCIKMNDSTW